MKPKDDTTTWANLTLEERVIDRLAAIAFAAEQIQNMLATERPLVGRRLGVDKAVREISDLVGSVFPILHRRTSAAGERDPDLEEFLGDLDRELQELEHLRGPERDIARGHVERKAAPYALALYYELRRLDDLRVWGAGLLPPP